MADFEKVRNQFLDLLAEHHQSLPREVVESALQLLTQMNRLQEETTVERSKRAGIESWARLRNEGKGDGPAAESRC